MGMGHEGHTCEISNKPKKYVFWLEGLAGDITWTWKYVQPNIYRFIINIGPAAASIISSKSSHKIWAHPSVELEMLGGNNMCSGTYWAGL